MIIARLNPFIVQAWLLVMEAFVKTSWSVAGPVPFDILLRHSLRLRLIILAALDRPSIKTIRLIKDDT